MFIEQFTVQPTFVIVLAIALAAVGIIILVTGLFNRPLEAPKLYSFGRAGVPVGKGTRRWTFVIVGIMLIGIGVGSYALGGLPSTITVGSGYVSIQSPPFFGAGNMKITSSEIASAYVGQIGSGNLTLSKQDGTNAGNLNIGVFTLGNGKTAYVVSTSSTDLIVQLNNGQYVILGTANTNALAAAFSQNVYQLKSP